MLLLGVGIAIGLAIGVIAMYVAAVYMLFHINF